MCLLVQVERDYMSNPGFTPDNIKSKSSAAAGLCAWVINICKYFRIYQVRPLREPFCSTLSFLAGRKLGPMGLQLKHGG